jgi:hypothetical protein
MYGRKHMKPAKSGKNRTPRRPFTPPAIQTVKLYENTLAGVEFTSWIMNVRIGGNNTFRIV